MKRYYSSVSPFTRWILIGSTLITWVVIIPVLMGEINLAFLLIVGFVGIYTVFMASIYFNTYYRIEEGKVIWVTGPIKGSLEIKEIREIKKADSMWEISSLIKPILSQRPLLLKYNKYDELPVSPVEEQEFITALLEVNAHILLRC